jgi:hypothetical protein
MIPKALDQIGKQDIDYLVAEARAERRTLEYKESLPGNGDEDKKEFLADVSSFANASGGDLLFGVVDKRDANNKPTGIPASAPGLAGVNAGGEKLRLESIIRDGIAPRVPGVRVGEVPGFAQGPVLLVRVPKSYAYPHMVTFKGSSRFYSRNSSGKYPLDVGEIRAAFALSESLPQRIRDFRAARVAAVVAGETPLVLSESPKVILHVLPLRSLDPLVRVDVTPFGRGEKELWPLYASRIDRRFNFDGVLVFTENEERGGVVSYAQLFRSGAVEAVECRMLAVTPVQRNLLAAPALELELIGRLDSYLSELRNLELGTPVYVMVTLLGVKGYHILWREETRHPIDRDTLFLPDILIEDYAEKGADKLKDAFDALWQAAGWERCFRYDERGRWSVSVGDGK